jgi:hypothetical protein
MSPKILIGLTALTLTVSPITGHSQKPSGRTICGVGMISCARWISDRKTPDSDLFVNQPDQEWLLGFLTAASTSARIPPRHIDRSPEKPSRCGGGARERARHQMVGRHDGKSTGLVFWSCTPPQPVSPKLESAGDCAKTAMSLEDWRSTNPLYSARQRSVRSCTDGVRERELPASRSLTDRSDIGSRC